MFLQLFLKEKKKNPKILVTVGDSPNSELLDGI